jgi:hypothetical protein
MSVILGAVFISAFAAYRMFFGGSIIFFDGAYFGTSFPHVFLKVSSNI